MLASRPVTVATLKIATLPRGRLWPGGLFWPPDTPSRSRGLVMEIPPVVARLTSAP